MIHGTTTSGDTLRDLNHDESNHMNALLEESHFRRQAEAPDVEPAIGRFQGAIDTIVQTELRRFQFRLRTLTPDQQQTIETLLRGIARELTARIRACLRRSQPLPEGPDSTLSVGDIVLNRSRHEVTKKGRKVHLTPKQFELLQFLMQNAGGAVPHGRLLRSVWGPEYGSELEYLRTFIRQIRLKIEDDPANPRYLLTDSHFGYRFEEPGPEPAVVEARD